MIVQHHANASSGRIVLVGQAQKLHKFRTAMAISNQAQHLPTQQVDTRQQGHRAVAPVFMIPSHRGMTTRHRRQIRGRVADRLNPGFLVITEYPHHLNRQAGGSPYSYLPVDV